MHIEAVPFGAVLPSLDLTDTRTVAQVVYLQSRTWVGGSLQTTGGIAVGGSMVVTLDDIAMVLTARRHRNFLIRKWNRKFHRQFRKWLLKRLKVR